LPPPHVEAIPAESDVAKLPVAQEAAAAPPGVAAPAAVPSGASATAEASAAVPSSAAAGGEAPGAAEPGAAEPDVAAEGEAELTATPPSEGEAASESDAGRTSVVISSVPGFSRALAFQRALSVLPGIEEAKAIGYERGVLGMEVQHDPDMDLAEALTTLPGIRLRVVESAPGQLHLSAE
jgi:hypothetical protein